MADETVLSDADRARFLDHETIAQHFDFLAKILRNTKSLKVLGEKKSRPTWQVAADEAEGAAVKIRAALRHSDESEPKTSFPDEASTEAEGGHSHV